MYKSELVKEAAKANNKKMARRAAKKAAKNVARKNKIKVKSPTLHDKVDKLTKTVATSIPTAKPKLQRSKFNAKKLGLISAGVAGASALVHKVRQNRLNQE